MKKIFFYLVFLVSLSACDTEGDYTDKGFIKWGGAEILWQADNTVKYKIAVTTADGDSIKSGYILPREMSGTTATLRVYKENDTKPELEKQITIENGGNVELIQMPGSSISIKEPVPANDADLPSNERNKFKLRLFYNNVEGWGDAVKVDLYYKTDPFTPMMDAYAMGISIDLQNGVLSNYVIIDLNKLSPDGGNGSSPQLLAVVTDKAGNVLLDARKDMMPLKGRIIYSYATGPEYSEANGGWTYGMKYVTCGLKISYDDPEFSYLFADAWE